MKSMTQLLPIVAVALFMGCAKPLPESKMEYAGEWSAPEMALLITPDGKVEYARKRGSTRTSVNAPIKEFQGNNIVVGIGPATTTFVVSVAPHQENGVWKMTVDDVSLTKK